MKLELRRFQVTSVEAGPSTRYLAGRLTIDVGGLETLLAEDPRLGSVHVQLAWPGESTRIIHVLDVMQPRVKVGKREGYFPRLLTESALAGEGLTHVLDNVGVVLTGNLDSAEEGIIDLSGPGGEVSTFGRMFHVVLLPTPASPDLDGASYGRAVIEAGAKAAVYLANATRGQEPDRVDVFDWERGVQKPDRPNLPRIAYISYVSAHGFGREKLWYGTSVRDLVPTVVHPNEILDGALIDNGYTRPIRNTTFEIANNAVLRSLYEHHGKHLVFAGMVLAPQSQKFVYKRAFAERAAWLCRSMLHADAVIITKDGGGQADVDVFQTITFCEELGIKTVAAVMELCGEDGADPPVVDSSVYATAMVSLGNGTEILQLPPVETVIGGDSLISLNGTAAGEIGIPYSYLVGAIDEMGGSHTYSQML